MNAKQEFIKHTKDKTVKCATIHKGDSYLYGEDYVHPPSITLPCNYNEEQYQEFLNKLNFEYDDGYSGRELFGTIWYIDGTWSERSEYDGSEWWNYQRKPQIPQELL